MPCDSLIQTETIFGKETDHNAMLAGLSALKLNPIRSGNIIYFSGGEYHCSLNKLTLNGTRAEERVREIKRSYVAEATKAQAKRFGFQVVQGKSQYEFNLVKRSI